MGGSREKVKKGGGKEYKRGGKGRRERGKGKGTGGRGAIASLPIFSKPILNIFPRIRSMLHGY